MARNDPSLVGLLKLPNELLLEIVSDLRTPDLRRLARVNRRLHFFVGDYLVRYRYHVGLVALPNELILEIVQHLGRQKDRSRLARASQKLYPLIMDYIVRHNIRYNESNLLNHVARRDLKGMARMILYLGGDVNTQGGVRLGATNKAPTPLAHAAFYGHEKMVRVLLKAGASHFVHGMRIPLAAAIHRRHETVASILSQELDPDDVILKKTGSTPLQMACKAKLVNLVRYYLERGSRCGGRANIHSLQNRSTALYLVLQKDASRGDFIKREIHEDVYQIVSMLLRHGANPDISIKVRSSDPLTTARAIASRHPDPRVRILLAKATRTAEPKGSNMLIGRPWIAMSGNEPLTFQELQSEASPSQASQYARLWDFLEKPNAETSNLLDEDGTEYIGTDSDNCTLSASDMADLAVGRTQWLKKLSESMGPPPLSSFPQLAIPKASVQHIAKDFWGKVSAEASLGVDSVRTPSIGGMGSISRKVKQLTKPVETEPFPRLGHTGLTSNDTGADLWGRLAKSRVSQSASETQQASPRREGNSMKSARKPSRKQKWEPFFI